MVEPGTAVKAILHDLRFKRHMVLSRDLPRIKGVCAWCRGKGRQGMKYCSEDCHDEADIRSNGTIAAKHVHQRDGAICSRCGIDTNIIAKAYRDIVYSYSRTIGLHFDLSLSKKWLEQWGPWGRHGYYDHFSEVHHIVPVHKGGGCCGIENLETLCVICHKEETRKGTK